MNLSTELTKRPKQSKFFCTGGGSGNGTALYEAYMTLSDLKPGFSGIITAVGGGGALRRRLLDMGLTPKTKVMVRKVAPMGDPVELHLRGYELTIRRDDAAKIEITEIH